MVSVNNAARRVRAPLHGSAADVVVIGAGPAGLTAAYELLRRSTLRPLVLEATEHVGGIARTEQRNGYRVDIGGHRFFTKVGEVEALWREVMGDDFITVRRLSRIYYQGRYYNYPLRLTNALANLGAYEAVRIGLSYAKWKTFPHRVEETFEQWVVNRFGGRLFHHFFRTYTEKVWGIPCSAIRADWAAQRIKNLSLRRAVLNSITRSGGVTSLIEQFQYPRLGPGMMWERFRDLVSAGGGEVRTDAPVRRIALRDGRVRSVAFGERGREEEVLTDHIISSMPITHLVRAITPRAPDAVLDAASRLKYRDFLIVALIIDRADPFPDNWIYIHSPDVKVGRIQNFRAWSREMVPDDHHASVGMEYFCHEGDGLWNAPDDDLVRLASSELEKLDLSPASSVVDGFVIRQPMAYPVYDAEYRENLAVIRDWLATIPTLLTVGRNGMHRYNNQDHSMLTAMLAVRNILGESHDLWNVNVERSYHEEFVAARPAPNGRAAAPSTPPSAARPAAALARE